MIPISRLINRATVLKVLPLLIVLSGLTLSFFYGWYQDNSKPHAGSGWADQGTYTQTTEKIFNKKALAPQDLHFSIGYPTLGVLGKLVISDDPFMAVSLVLLLGSGAFIFLAIRQLLGAWWAVGLIALLFYWDGVARSFHFVSELFTVPWNNQVLFFVFSFFLWLLVTKTKQQASYPLAGLAGLMGGLSFVTREESILFIAPLLVGYLFITKTNWRKWLLSISVLVFCFTPQAIVKTNVLGSIAESGHDYSYIETISKYFNLERFVSNVSGVLIDSGHADMAGDKITRPALLQVAPWLWLSPIGIGLMLFLRRYPSGLKIFVLVSLLLIFFYLSGVNMSPQKLAFHCLRYISPGFITLYLGVIITIVEGIRGARYIARHKSVTSSKWYYRSMSKIESSAIYWLQITIVALPIVLAVFGISAISFLILGEFHTYYVLPVGSILASLVFYFVWRQQKERRFFSGDEGISRFTIFAVLFVIIWTAFNLYHHSEHVFVNRDPAIYTVTAKFLQNQPNLKIDKIDGFSEQDGFFSSAAGFDASRIDSDELFAQGAHLLSSLLGLGARLLGDNVIFTGNIVLGGIALLTFFGFCLNYIRAKFAFLALISLGLLLPFIYFSRDVYTEILALTFVFGSLTLLYHAIERKSTTLWAFAGLTLGAGALTRIDAYLSVAAALTFVGVYLVLQRSRKERQQAVWQTTVFTVGMAGASTIGLLDISTLASGYFASEWRYISLELYLIAAIVVAVLIMVPIAWKTRVIKSLDKFTSSWRSTVAVTLFCAFWVVMGLRFVWMDNPQLNAAVMIVPFIGAYLGPLMLFAGIVGLSVILYKVLQSKSYALKLLPFLIVTMSIALLYISKPSIAPDHVWASRRFLPIVLPALIFAAFYLVHLFYERKEVNKKRITDFRKYTYVVLIGLMVASPLVLTHRFITLSSFKQVDALNSVCADISKDSTLIWVGSAGMDATIATRAYCGVDSVRFSNGDKPLDKETLAEVYKLANIQENALLIGSYEEDINQLPDDSQLSLVSEKYTENVELVYKRPPAHIVNGYQKIYIGKVTSEGRLVELNK